MRDVYEMWRRASGTMELMRRWYTNTEGREVDLPLHDGWWHENSGERVLVYETYEQSVGKWVPCMRWCHTKDGARVDLLPRSMRPYADNPGEPPPREFDISELQLYTETKP